MLNLPPNRRVMPFVFSPLERNCPSTLTGRGWRESPLFGRNRSDFSSSARRYEFFCDSCSPLFLIFSFLYVPLPRNNPELQQLHISTCHAGKARQWREAEALAAASSQRRGGVRFTKCQKTKIHLPLCRFEDNYLKYFSDIPGSLPSYKITQQFLLNILISNESFTQPQKG